MKQVYTFGNGQAEGRADMKNLLGGKGANLAEMNLIGVPVPPGFTITTEICTAYNQHGKDAVVKMLKSDVEKSIAHIENLMGTKFGDAENPLLVSVRSGARVSMPGMMDTVLNLGMNDSAVEGIFLTDGSGQVLCYHKSRPQVFADFLYQNTRLEKGAVEKDKYGFLERENGVWYFKLNVKIGLVKR